jgi:hypothetical protein
MSFIREKYETAYNDGRAFVAHEYGRIHDLLILLSRF